MYNKLFIKSTSDLISSYENQIRVIDDTFYYYINQNELDLQTMDNQDYAYLESLKKDRAILSKDQQILERKKDSLGFIQLLFWQSGWIIAGPSWLCNLLSK